MGESSASRPLLFPYQSQQPALVSWGEYTAYN